MQMIVKTEDGHRPSEIDFVRYIFKVLRLYGYGDEATVTLRWTIGSHTLILTLENKDIKFLS